VRTLLVKIFFATHTKEKQVPDRQEVTHKSSRNPYRDLYIYYLEGCLNREKESFLGPDFLGNWIEEDSSFLFFSHPSKDLVQEIVAKGEKTRLIEEFHFTYEEWQGGKLTPHRVSRFFIVPPWEEIKEEKGEIRLLLDPGVVFGTSLHPTTRDCLSALVKIYEEERQLEVLDLGTGTGILAVAAALLGAERILAVDINPLAGRTALLNSQLNGVDDRIEVREGLAEDFMDDHSDLVIANIHFDVVSKLIAHDGFLKKKYFILSGLMRSQASDISAQLSRYPVEIMYEWDHDMVWRTVMGKVKERISG
jgi:ribosomal protein L11 methyltransferase